MTTHSRPERVADQIQIELADIIQRRLKDPRRGFFTLTGVRVTRDLRQATVFVSALDDGELRRALSTLGRAKGFLRSELAKRIRLRFLPELHFAPDEAVGRGVRVEELLRELHERGELPAGPVGPEGGDGPEDPEGPGPGTSPDGEPESGA